MSMHIEQLAPDSRLKVNEKVDNIKGKWVESYALTLIMTVLKIVIKCWDQIVKTFSPEVVEKLSTVHLAFETECEVIGNGTFEIWIPFNKLVSALALN